MLVLEAEEKLAAGCEDAEVYDLVLAATGSEDRASEALAKRYADRQKLNEPVEG